MTVVGAVAMAVDMTEVAKPRVRVDATVSKGMASRRGVGTLRPSYSGFVGAGSGGPTRADHRESARMREPSRLGREASGSEGDARMHEKSKLPGCGRTCWASVEGRKGLTLEPATVLLVRTTG